eukprot:TRINITY_DN3069_c0_g1_i1.p1 TRINITY_DN3069_c0_g1~~TRINITY_DN3069_c0_g1_i1.p1  ORF type:complete len:275 (-),score=54.46 TRINITY_DN3069_c0_g1_i1:156-980(-)
MILLSLPSGSVCFAVCPSFVADLWCLFCDVSAAIIASISFVAVIVMVFVGRWGEQRVGNVTVTIRALQFSLLSSVVPRVILPTFVACCIYSTDVAYLSVATQVYFERWGLDPVASGRVLSIGLLCTMCLSPVVGAILIKLPFRSLFMFVGLGLMAAGFALQAGLTLEPIPAVVLFGIGMAAGPTSFWPCIDLCVTPDHVGTAIGFTMAIESAAIFGFTNLAIFMHTKYESYVPMLWLMSAVCCAGAAAVALWTVLDWRSGNKINRNTNVHAILE